MDCFFQMAWLYLFGEECLQFLFIKKAISIGICIINKELTNTPVSVK